MPTLKIKMLNGDIATTTTPPNITGEPETWTVGFAPTKGNAGKWALVLKQGTPGLDGEAERAHAEIVAAGNVGPALTRDLAMASAMSRKARYITSAKAELMAIEASSLDDYLAKLELVADWATLDGALIWTSSLLDEEEEQPEPELETSDQSDDMAIDYDAVDPLTP